MKTKTLTFVLALTFSLLTFAGQTAFAGEADLKAIALYETGGFSAVTAPVVSAKLDAKAWELYSTAGFSKPSTDWSATTQVAGVDGFEIRTGFDLIAWNSFMTGGGAAIKAKDADYRSWITFMTYSSNGKSYL